MNIEGKIIAILLLIPMIGLTYFFLRMDKKYIKEGKYWKPIYSGKTTIWQIPFYIVFVIIMILLGVLFGS